MGEMSPPTGADYASYEAGEANRQAREQQARIVALEERVWVLEGQVRRVANSLPASSQAWLGPL